MKHAIRHKRGTRDKLRDKRGRIYRIGDVVYAGRRKHENRGVVVELRQPVGIVVIHLSSYTAVSADAGRARHWPGRAYEMMIEARDYGRGKVGRQ